ncbi:MAG: MFS transporter [Kofleriaceae bacterium]|nr:MFS transporter [Kofleriaceae bacterium]MCB9573784.1 MFS transporter [Kofleriaceae bacterium]
MPSSAVPPRLWSRGLVIVSAVLFLGAMLPNMFVLASRYLGARGFDEQAIGQIMGTFNLASLAGFLLAGRLTARVGHGVTLALGCVVASIGGVVFEASTGFAGLAAARGLQGLGFSAVLVGAAAYVAESAPLPRLGQALGIAGVLTLSAQAAGPALGEALRDLAGWTWVFRVGAIAGLGGAVVALALPPVRRSDDDGDRAPRSARDVLAATALAAIGFGAMWTFLADYARQVHISRTTYFFVPYVLAAVSTRLFLGALSDRVGRRQAATPALVGHAAILIVMVVLSAAWQLVVVGLVYGLCHGIYYPTLQAMIVERAGGRRSRAIATSTFAFGAGVLIAAFGLGPVARAAGYPTIYGLASAAGLAAAALIARSP